MAQSGERPRDLNEVLVFARVVEAGSFVAASRELEMPKSTVSRKVAELEERLGARLLQRTTRKLSLTDVGRAYYQHAARVVAELEEAELAVSRLQGVPRGPLRVTMPLNFGYLAPVVASFMARYPEVRLEVVCADRVVDLIQEGFDVAIRAGRLSDSALLARSLGVLRHFVVASPAFLDAHGVPETPEDLQEMHCLSFGAGAERTTWILRRQGTAQSVRLRPRLIVNDYDFLDECARSGLGVALLPAFRCAEAIRAGGLRRVLPDWCSSEVPVAAVYPSGRHLSPKVTAFLEHLRERLAPPPWELTPAP